MVKGGVWKNTEDEILKAAVMKYGKNNWARVASLMNRKSAKQCKARWYEWLDPSIRKVDWSREEEEKLLHLAKLMPNQWRSIAPIVGRTAVQCIEHYEELLDRANDGDAEKAEGSEDPRKLRPGEIDPAPENKPARPDPVDMDEDEKEMLSEARARLANTKGKKAKRKAREKQLEEAHHLAVLQKHRELKAAGVESRLLLGKKRKQGIDYLHEVPFQKMVPAGFYDVNDEEQAGKRAKLDPRKSGRDMLHMEMEGRAEAEFEERAKKKTDARAKYLFRENAPAAILKIAQENDPAALRRRSLLLLPAPQVSDAELETIVKMGQRGMGPGEGQFGMPPPQSSHLPAHPSALVGSSSGAGAIVLQGPTRTPLQEDVLMQEARNLRALRSAVPLSGQELPELFEGTGFAGAQPRSHRLATPNAILAPTPSSVRSGTAGGASVGGYSSMAPTPVSWTGRKGAAGNWVAGSDAGSFADNQSDSISITTSAASIYAREQRLALLSSLKALPEPEFVYEVAVPALPVGDTDDVDGTDAGTGPRKRVDAAEAAARARSELALQEAQALARRSSAVARGLPRPQLPLLESAAALLTGKGSGSLVGIGGGSQEGQVRDVFGAVSNFSAAEMETVREAVGREMLQILSWDQVSYPYSSEGGAMVGGKRQRNQSAASVGSSSSSSSSSARRVAQPSGPPEAIPDELLQAARAEIKKETSLLLRDDPVLAALPSAQERTAYAARVFAEAWDEARAGREFIPKRQAFGIPASAEDMLDARVAQLSALQSHAEREHKRAAKLEAKLALLTAGYQDRAGRAGSAMNQAFAVLQQRSIDLDCFKKAREAEAVIAARRKAEADAEAKQAQAIESGLQQYYASLQ